MTGKTFTDTEKKKNNEQTPPTFGLGLPYGNTVNILPDSLCGNIFSKRENYYLLRGHEVHVAAIRRHKSRFMKDSLAYRGPILWNLVDFNEKITNVSFNDLNKTPNCQGLFQRFYL